MIFSGWSHAGLQLIRLVAEANDPPCLMHENVEQVVQYLRALVLTCESTFATQALR